MDPHPVQEDDSQLVGRARSGDPAAWQVLFERHRDMAYRVAWRVTGSSEDALDAVQDGFIRAYRNLGSLTATAGFRAWLMRIVYHRAIDIRRSRPRQRILSINPDEEGQGPVVPDTRADADPTQRVARSELGKQLAQALETLPADQRQALVLHTDGQMTYAEIAGLQGVPIGTVMSRIYYARRKLQCLLADVVDDSPGSEGRGKEAAP